jgi:hypothetical protein
MAEEKLSEAVREIERSATTWVVKKAAQEALKTGTNEALVRGLVIARESGQTLHVINTANKALGFDNE